ncbi:hypothetical protein AYK24_03705 [Thermoplasmatales archaeon SG8-52-4]|nr:MAG: hypothetical protein AYK24_03705 [Thermoplasmatales archaeon SG8-52-4]
MKQTILILGIIFLFVGISISPIVGSISKVNQSINQKLLNTSLGSESDISLITVKVAGEKGLDDWFNEACVNFTYESEDISLIKYRVNQGPLQNYTEPFFITDEGEDIWLEWCAVDYVGNQSEIDGPFIFNLDQTDPIIDLTYEWTDGPEPGTWWLIFTATAADALSKMDRVEFLLNGVLQDTVYGQGPDYQWEFLYRGNLRITIESVAYDNAGNSAIDGIYPPGEISIAELSMLYTDFNMESKIQTYSNNVLSSEFTEIDNTRFVEELSPCNNHVARGFDPTYNIIVFDRTIKENGWLADNASIYFQYDYDKIAEVYYQINGGEWILYNEPLVISDDGIYVFSWYVIDSEGHSSSPEHISFKKDLTSPKINLKVERLWFNKYKLTADASDETSGIKIVEFLCLSPNAYKLVEIKDKEFPYECIINTFRRVLIFRAYAYDNAGNCGANEIYYNFNYDYFIKPIHPFLLRFLDHFPLLHHLLDIWRCNLF